jgi:Family of unknown function (DUF5715)
MGRRIVFIFVVIALTCGGVWAFFHFKGKRRLAQSQIGAGNIANSLDADAWYRAVERVKTDRGGEGAGALQVPPELRHYEERYWFLATQVAEIEKYKIYTCQDYLDLATLIERGEIVPVPAVTDTYVLLGVGQRADDSEFSRYEEDKSQLEQSNQQPVARPDLSREYESLQTLAKNFNGRSYNLDNPSDRLALKLNMLSSLRPQALKIMEEVAASYQRQFDRPLHISSLVRPEQYQRALRRVNRNAVTIDSPPHSTGLAFDIDYRYMSAAEQNFVMSELARLKNAGRIEVIRERNANFHVFAFLNGSRPGDDLVAASLEKAGAPVEEEAHHKSAEPAKPKSKVKPKATKTRRSQGNVRKSRKRRR